MLKRLSLLTLALILTVSAAKADEWTVDGAHSSVDFSIRHMVVAKVNGKFDEFAGTLTWDGKDLKAGSVKFTIQAGSVNTSNTYRDQDLKGEQFFDVAKFPTIEFVSRKVVPGDGNAFTLVGDLTLKGVTKEVTFECEFGGTVVDAKGNTHAGFSARTKINRQDYGVSWSKALDNGGLVAGNDVEISLEIEAIKPKA